MDVIAFFQLSKAQAQRIKDEVLNSVVGWEKIANSIQISRSEQQQVMRSVESVQLNYSMPDRVKECWRKSSNQHWSKSELIGQLALNHLWETSCVDPHAGCCGG